MKLGDKAKIDKSIGVIVNVNKYNVTIRKGKRLITDSRKNVIKVDGLGDHSLNAQNFEKCRWNEVRIDGISLNDCDLSSSYFTNTFIHSSSAQRSEFARSKFTDCTFIGIDFSESRFYDCDINDCKFENCNFSKSNLRHVNFNNNNTIKNCNFTGSDIDFSSLTLSCSGLRWKVDESLASQFLYHICSMECNSEDFLELRDKMIPLANKFHRVPECGTLYTRQDVKNSLNALILSGYKWITKDEGGTIYAFKIKPIRQSEYWYSGAQSKSLPRDLNRHLTINWKDEPTEIKEIMGE